MPASRRGYYRVTRALADHEIILDMAEFALLDRRVRDAVLATGSTFPFVRGQVGYVGFRRVGIPYNRERRLGGKSHYNLIRAFKFGLGGILSSSTFPLRLLAYGGAVMLPLAIAALVLLAVIRPPLPVTVIGVAAVFTLLLLWIVLGLGILGIYLARVYKDQVGLPLYVIDRQRSLMDDDGRNDDQNRP
jgi:dolichol-phosphate mannosyltransferase